MLLQNYDYKIEHRPGERILHVDALSRCNSILILEPNTFEQTLLVRQDKDKEISTIRDCLLENIEDKFHDLRNGLVYRKSKNNYCFTSLSIWNNVIRTCHDDLGHLGIDKVIYINCLSVVLALMDK